MARGSRFVFHMSCSIACAAACVCVSRPLELICVSVLALPRAFSVAPVIA